MEPKREGTQHWDDFISWIRASSTESHVYWVHGKIGAGKTTLLRFLDDNLDVLKHMLPWAKDGAVVRASCFFWNAGNELQKSTVGLLRTLLNQLFDETPDLIPRVVHLRKWQTARLTGNHVIDWTDSELKDCFREYMLHASKSRKVLLLVDGLDEFGGNDEEREDLIDLLVASATNENVKICLSSRPWNIFHDAFESCPQLRLEDFTYNDISAYVRERLYSNKRFQKLIQYDTVAAEGLVASLISKAAGVFLWVRLVVKQLLEGLRDGDGILTISKRIEEIPADLDDYFMRLMESIEPQNRKEASELFQLALYDEEHFISVLSNTLLDFSFIEEGKPDFALSPSYKFSKLDFADLGAMAFRIESTMRKVNSRCMRLLQYHYDVSPDVRMSDSDGEIDDESSSMTDFGCFRRASVDVPADATKQLDRTMVLSTVRFSVEFLHQSLHDFLLTPKVQTLLHHYTQGPYDARMFFRNARLVQLLAFSRADIYFSGRIGLASYILSTLAVPEYRDTSGAADIATRMQPVVEDMVREDFMERITGWYICYVLHSWHDEDSNFLTLAIDFGLNSYIRAHLTCQSILSKKGRPILDYILRPRFRESRRNMCIGSQMPDSALLQTVLGFGADPNQKYQGVSV